MCPFGAAFALQPAVFSLLLPHAEIGKHPKCTCYVPGPNYDCKFVLGEPSKATNPLTSGVIALTTLNVVTTRVTANQQSLWKVCSTIWKYKAYLLCWRYGKTKIYLSVCDMLFFYIYIILKNSVNKWKYRF